MDEKLKDQDVLLVAEKGSTELKAVKGMEKGELQTTHLDPRENNNFLKIDKNGNALENFMSNFMRQAKDPTHFQFFKVPLDYIAKAITFIEDGLKNPKDPDNANNLEQYRVKPEDFAKKQSHAIDESRIDWKQLERLGVTRESLEKSNSLDAMLNFQKSPGLIPIVAKFDDVTLKTDARLSFRETPEGNLTVAIHALRKEPELERPYFGMKFSDDDKKNLLSTGNLGRVADVQFKQGESTPVFLSLDKLTNELVAVRADKIKIPETIKGVTLEDKQKQALAEGKSVLVEGMTAKNGKEFSAHIQVNADKKGIEFQFDNNGKKQEQNQNQQQSASGELRIPTKLGGVELTQKQQSDLKGDKTIYVSGMVDKQGQEYNAYVKVNHEAGKLDFFKWNPDKAKEIKPDEASKTQVAVNSEGKTNEATKKVDEPLKKGQTQPTEKQEAKQEKKEEKKQAADKPKKSQGRKM